MKMIPMILLGALLVTPARLVAQGAYLNKGVNGFGTEARAVLSLEGFDGVGITSGYSIAGILDIGADLGLSLGELGGREAADVRVAMVYNVSVLKQSEGVPVSLQVLGSYGATTVISNYLDEDGAQRRGLGYTIGVSLSRSFRLTPVASLRLSLLADYESAALATTGGTAIPDSTEYRRTLFAGVGVGAGFAFPRGTALVITAQMRADQDFRFEVRPILAFAVPTD